MRELRVIYIRPSTYDDDGYVLRYWRGVLPSNTLACLQSLTKAVADSGTLGPDVKVTVDVYDDTVEKIPIEKFARLNRRPDTQVVVGFVGVQTNQFVRTSDLSIQLRKAGVQVMIGGFHVSGMLSLFGEPTPELQRLLQAGVSLVRGEAEAPGALARILKDALDGEMEPIYNIVDFPDLQNAPVPRMLGKLQKKFLCSEMATIDSSRGCPFNCSFCTIINVQGRKMRYRSAECVLNAIEENYRHGITVYFFTDDNFSRNPAWEKIFDGLIAMKERGIDIVFMMQIDTQAHKIPRFAEKASKAGCYLTFVGMESVNPKNLEAVGKKQNHASEYGQMVATWHANNVMVHVGYIIGLPDDTRESVAQDMETLRNQVKVDFASFFMLTPLPGSRDHWKMVQDGVCLDADYNNYDSLHETFRHAKMPPGEWRLAYDESMRSMYSKESIVNALLNTPRTRRTHLFWLFMWYRYSALEGCHPMATGLFRRKERTSRRMALPQEGRLRYAWRRLKDTAHGIRRYGGLFFDFQEIWMLTCRPDDPRWTTLAELRMRWAEVQQRVALYDLRGRYDDAAQELRNMLVTSAERLKHLSETPVNLSQHARTRLNKSAKEIENYIRSFDLQLTGWRKIVDAEKYVSEQILSGYEEAVIRYVASRRKFNAYRHELIERFASGRVWTLDILKVFYATIAEFFLACRFGVGVLTHR